MQGGVALADRRQRSEACRDAFRDIIQCGVLERHNLLGNRFLATLLNFARRVRSSREQ
jgi:hypothetical protein